MNLLRLVRSRPNLRHILVFSHDMLVAAVAFGSAFAISYGYPEVLSVPGLYDKLSGFLLCAAAAFLIFGSFRGTWRYVSTPDMVIIAKAVATAVVLYTIGAFLLTRGENVPRSSVVLVVLFMAFGMAGARLCFRIFLERMDGLSADGEGAPTVRRVLLCGLSDKADSFIRANHREGRGKVEIVGLLDESHINSGRTIQGVKVLGSLGDLESIVAQMARTGKAVSEIVLTETAPEHDRIAHVLDRANAVRLKCSIVPDLSRYLPGEGQAEATRRPVELRDLIDRPQLNTDTQEVSRLVADRVVLITGAGGSIGSELSRQVAAFGPKQLVITDSSEYLLYQLETELRDTWPELALEARIVNVRDRRRVEDIFARYSPQIVFHAAALKHVPIVEANPLEGIKTNLLGTRYVADASLANNAEAFVLMSTDKAVNPKSIMGATKRAAESYCQSLDFKSRTTHFATVRFGNVFGSLGSVVPRFDQQIAAGGPVTVTHPHMVRFFMSIPESILLVLHASAHAILRRSERGKIIVLDMGKPVRIIDLAERMIQLAGYKPHEEIRIVYSGLRPGEKLFEELFDPREIQDGHTEEGYVLASPRFADHKLIAETLHKVEACIEQEDAPRAVQLLRHLVPEYRTEEEEGTPTLKDALGEMKE